MTDDPMVFTREQDTSIVSLNERAALSRHEIWCFLNRAMKRKHRRAGRIERFMRQLDRMGRFEETWNFVHRIATRDDQWVTVGVAKILAELDEQFALRCNGPQADALVDHVNTQIVGKTSKSAKKHLRFKKATVRKQKLAERKRERMEARAQERRERRQAESKKRKRAFVPAAISHKRIVEGQIELMPQFKEAVLFRDTIVAVQDAFEIVGNEYRTGYQIVAAQLSKSTKNSGQTFAQFKRAGFCLRFDFIGGYRGLMTPVSISCTKDTSHPAYQRMRAYFRHFFQVRSSAEDYVVEFIAHRAVNDNFIENEVAA